MGPEIKSVQLSSEVTLQYVEQGDPAGLPVLLLHGYTDSWYSFAPVLPFLPASIHALALTQRGHGDSDHPTAGYRPADYAADVGGFLDVLGIKSAIIVGHSMGSFAGQRFALDFPDRTLGLVLVGSATAMHGNLVWLALGEDALKLTDPVDPGFVRGFQQSTLAQPVPDFFLQTVVQESLKVPARVWIAAWQGLWETDFSSELSRIKVPTLMVWGDQDGLFSRSEQEALQAAIAGSRLIVYPGAGHAAHWEEPERFASDLWAFVKTFGIRRGV
jgi:non-heme chloroperoxidase